MSINNAQVPATNQVNDEQYLRSDVFISYNHNASKPFARKLVKRLEIEFSEVWFDEQDIPAGVNYVNHFLDGLRRSDVVVMILSNDYVTSENCQLELRNAEKLQKRILTIVHQREPQFDFGALKQLSLPVSQINAIFFTDEEKFEESFAVLLKAIKTDQAYVRQHTDYLIKVDEWLSNDRDDSYLLHGDQIKKAEDWRDDQGTLEPLPTEDQLKYIRLSRERQIQLWEDEVKRKEEEQALKTQAAKRQRNFTILLFVGMLAVLVYLVTVAGQLDNRNQRLQERRIDDTATVALEIFLTADDNFANLQSALVNNDGDLIAQLVARHETDMQSLSILYPTINFYTTTTDFALVIDNSARVVPEAEFATVYNRALNTYQDFATYSDFPFALYTSDESIEIAGASTDSYRVAFVPIPDAQGIDVGYLILEVANPVESVVVNLYFTLFIVGLVYVVLIGIYLFAFSRRRVRAFTQNRRSRRQKSTETT